MATADSTSVVRDHSGQTQGLYDKIDDRVHQALGIVNACAHTANDDVDSIEMALFAAVELLHEARRELTKAAPLFGYQGSAS